jgi:hypothetical protein
MYVKRLLNCTALLALYNTINTLATDSRSAGQELPPRMYYRLQKSTPLHPIPSQLNPVNTLTPCVIRPICL